MIKKYFAKFLLWIAGWKIRLDAPLDSARKCVMIAAPHTSNWDFYYSLLTFWSLNLKFRFFIKDSYTKSWYGFVFKAIGAIGIDRSARHNRVEQVAMLLKQSNELILLVPAEGTRKRVERWKTGFYYIAKKAQVPIFLSYLDYDKKFSGIGKTLFPSDDFSSDMSVIEAFYQDKRGKHPHLYNPKIF